jgi:hypothetical protein
MHTEAFNTFKTNISQLLGHINTLDLLLQLSNEKIAEFKKEKGDQAKHITLQVPGIVPKDARKYGKLFGAISINLSKADSLASPVMLTTCKNALVTLIAVTEGYLRDIAAWIFRENPNAFKSNKEIRLTHKDALELGDYQSLLDKVLGRIMSDITKRNIADSLDELFVKVCGWEDTSGLNNDLTVLRNVSAIRNVVVHNQSKVNEIFLSMVSEPDKYTLGQKLVVSPQEIRSWTYAVIGLLKELDKIALFKCAKYDS